MKNAEIAEGPVALAKLILGLIALHGFIYIIANNREGEALVIEKVHSDKEFIELMKTKFSEVTNEHGPFESLLYDDQKSIISLGYLKKGAIAELMGATLQ